ncbi:hypothetical protein ACQ4PT_065262 [Festuca glaucescens]
MAARAPLPPRSGAPSSNPPLRQPIPPRSIHVRDGRGDGGVVGREDEGASASGVVHPLGREGQGDQQSRMIQPTAFHFEQGSSSGQGGRSGDWQAEGFNGHGFGGYESGYFEGNNGYGSNNRGNFRQRPYHQFFPGNRARHNNFRGGSGRFNGNNNRYQRVFNTNENNVVTALAQVQNTVAQATASDPGNAAASLNVQNMETSFVESLSNRAQKKIDKMLCLRCGENGHLAESCTASLCLYCEMTSHESSNCPLHSMPKPVAITYGVSRNELIFHEIPASSDVTFRHDSGKVGRISVTDGVLSSQEIVKELEWIIPGNHQWDLIPTDHGAFKAIFPSKADLARMTKIINVPVHGTSMFLHFEEWSAADLDKFYLTPVWVRVHGCCYKERCDYLSLFGVG